MILARFLVSRTAYETAWSDAVDFFLSDDLDVFLAGLSAASWAAFFELDRFYFAALDISFFILFYLISILISCR